jgi:hypothetical protein
MVAEVLLRERASRTLIPRTLIAIALGAAVAVAAIAGVPSPRANAAAPSTTGGVTVTVAADNEGVLASGAPLDVSVTIENSGTSALSAGSATLWMAGTPLLSRAALTTWMTQTDVPAGSVQLGSTPTDVIEPGIPYTYRISAPAATLPLADRTSPGGFGIAVVLDSAGTSVGGAHGVVTWNAGKTPPVHVAVAVPITVPPTTTGIVDAAELTTYTAPNGILTRELDAVAANPQVAVGIDPMIIASIRALNTAAPPSAIDWLRELASIPNPTFPLQYGDADPSGQIQAGTGKLLEPTSLAFATNASDFKTPATPVGEPTSEAVAPTPTPTPGAPTSNLPTLKELLAWTYTLSGIAWPADDTVRSSDIAEFATDGLRTTILSTDNTNASTLSAMPGPTLRVGDQTAVAADAGVSEAVRAAATATTTTQWNAAMADANAQLQLIAGGSPSPQTILVTLDRETPSTTGELTHTLTAITGTPWSTPAPFASVVNAAPTSGLELKDSPEASTRLSSIQFLVKREAAVDDFSSILDNPATLAGQTRAQLLTTLGVGWEEPTENWDQGVSLFVKSTGATLGSVSILSTDNVNLVSTQGSIPFTVSNTLPNEAVTVVLSALPSNGRLAIKGDTTKRVEADSRATVFVPVKAELGNGKVTLRLQLYSKTGVPIGAPTTVPVEVHADWEGIGALIVGILLVLLFGVGIVRNILRRRRPREDGGDEDGDGDADAPRDGEPDVAADPAPAKGGRGRAPSDTGAPTSGRDSGGGEPRGR